MRQFMTFVSAICLAAGFSMTTACNSDPSQGTSGTRRGGSKAYKKKAEHLRRGEQGPSAKATVGSSRRASGKAASAVRAAGDQ